MSRLIRSALFCCAMFGLMVGVRAADEKATVSPLSYKMKGIDGKDIDLADYKGKVVLIVNVASKCGYTKQYTGLEALHDKYGKDGLVVLGVPANDFGKQEPGSDAEIAQFYSAEVRRQLSATRQGPDHRRRR
ncbi:MAG: glutathione peroxidase [Pirellulales bacterium]